MALDPEIATAVRDAARRVLEGRERTPGNLPYPPGIWQHVARAVWPFEDPDERRLTKPGRALSKVTMQVYVAGWHAGRACDAQIADQVRQALGLTVESAPATPHPHIGVAVCLVCDQAPEHVIHHQEEGDTHA